MFFGKKNKTYMVFSGKIIKNPDLFNYTNNTFFFNDLDSVLTFIYSNGLTDALIFVSKDSSWTYEYFCDAKYFSSKNFKKD